MKEIKSFLTMNQKNNLTILLFALSAMINVVAAQECGTHVTEKQVEYLSKNLEARSAFNAYIGEGQRSSSAYTWVPIQMHDFTNSIGQGKMDQVTLWRWMVALNERFEPYGIQFYECADIDVKYQINLYDFESSEEPLLSSHDVSNVLNIYFFNQVRINGVPVCGYSYLPPSQDRVIMSKNTACILSEEVFLHEIGHYFSLYHTHGKFGTSGSLELVTRGLGANCTYEGDDLCDTPADPGLSVYGAGCGYNNSTLTDANGDVYTPMTDNIMSYSGINCKDVFTLGQMNRMVYSILNDRSYLTGCAHPAACDNPISSFPYYTDFESGFNGWYNKNDFPGAPVMDFNMGSGPTPTLGTGPSGANSGSNYAFIEADDQPYGGYSAIASPCLDLRGTVDPKFEFYYHGYGANIYRLGAQISLDGGYTWVSQPSLLWLVSGDQGNAWQKITVDLVDYKSSPFVQLRIVGSANGSQGDFALDDLKVYDAQATCNLELTHVSFDETCFGNDGWADVDITSGFTLPVNFAWSNGNTGISATGLSAGTYTVTATDANGCTGSEQVTINMSNTLDAYVTVVNETGPGASDGEVVIAPHSGQEPFTYSWSTGATTASVSNLAYGPYEVTITDASGCQIIRYPFIATTVSQNCTKTQNNFPYNHGFESGLGLFRQETVIDDKQWKRRSGPTPTSNTGPSSAYEGSYYRYIESSGQNNREKVSILKTKKCLNLTNLNNPVFEMYYHMFGSNMGSLEVQVSTNYGSSWITLWEEDQETGNQWLKMSLDLSNHKTDHTLIRIVGTTGAGNRSDIAIDSYFIGESGMNSAFEMEGQIVESNEIEVKLYPNPASNVLYFSGNQKQVEYKVDIYDNSGRLVKSMTKVLSFDNRIDIVDLAAGNYFVRITSQNESISKKLIIVR